MCAGRVSAGEKISLKNDWNLTLKLGFQAFMAVFTVCIDLSVMRTKEIPHFYILEISRSCVILPSVNSLALSENGEYVFLI